MKPIDISRFSIEDLLLSAIRAEIDSFLLYFQLSKSVQNVFLREKLDFLAVEESKHKEKLQQMYEELFAPKKPEAPEEPVVPLPKVAIAEEGMPLSRVLQMAMEGERAAAEFYRQISALFPEDKERKSLLLYFASMEDGHYKLLDIELENIARLEEFGEVEEMVHIGP